MKESKECPKRGLEELDKILFRWAYYARNGEEYD